MFIAALVIGTLGFVLLAEARAFEMMYGWCPPQWYWNAIDASIVVTVMLLIGGMICELI